MTSIQSHRDLLVWKKAIQLSVTISALVKALPGRERFSFGDQITRSSRSVHSNIAEGHGRGTRRDYLNFLTIANGSLQETDSLLVEAISAGLVREEQALPAIALVQEISRMLGTLRRRLKQDAGFRG